MTFFGSSRLTKSNIFLEMACRIILRLINEISPEIHEANSECGSIRTIGISSPWRALQELELGIPSDNELEIKSFD